MTVAKSEPVVNAGSGLIFLRSRGIRVPVRLKVIKVAIRATKTILSP